MRLFGRLMATVFVFIVLSLGVAWAENPDVVVGKWLTAENKSQVEIYKVGSQYFGKIIWLKEPNKDGKPKIDDKNPNEKLRKQPIIGLVLLNNFRYNGDNVWKDGTIYDPDNGKTYSCKMTLADNGELKIRGFIGISLIGRTTVWVRAQ
jgi:uncharacterized protein (DUF2147 family)